MSIECGDYEEASTLLDVLIGRLVDELQSTIDEYQDEVDVVDGRLEWAEDADEEVDEEEAGEDSSDDEDDDDEPYETATHMMPRLLVDKAVLAARQKQFNYSSKMQIPVLKKIVVNQGLGEATQDRKIIDIAINEITTITGQKAVATYSKKDIANFKLRKKMPIGVMVTLRRERMYEFLERLIRIALPRIRDFKGIESKFDGRGNYTLGIQEQIIFPEINIDTINKIQGMNITFVTSAKTDEEGYALLKAFGLPFKNAKKD